MRHFIELRRSDQRRCGLCDQLVAADTQDTAKAVLSKNISLDAGSRIACGSEESSRPGQIQEKGPRLQRFPGRRIAADDLRQRTLSMRKTRGVRGKNVETGTQLDGPMDRHPFMHTFGAGFRGYFAKQGLWLIQRSDPERLPVEKGVGQARERNFKRWNGEADDMAVHDRTIGDRADCELLTGLRGSRVVPNTGACNHHHH
jgi:hypothetical protein